jgi:hypothetical protein
VPSEDVKYFGSFYDKTFAPTEKIIIAEFESREQVLQAEIDLHLFFQVRVNPHFANRARQTNLGFDGSFKGYKHAEESKIKMSTSRIGNRNAQGRRSPECCERISKGRTGVKQKPRTPEHCAAISRAKTGQKQKETWWQCTVSGHISLAGPLTNYQRSRGIDTTNRVRLPELYG